MKFLSFLILLSCNTVQKVDTVRVASNSVNPLALSIKVTENYDIKIFLKNSSDKSFEMSSPEYYVNSSLTVKKSNINIDRKIRIKPNYGNREKRILIEAKQEVEFLYPYNLVNMYELKKESKYMVYYEFAGSILDQLGSEMQHRLSDKKMLEYK